MNFEFDPAELPSDAWMYLGETVAKLQWISTGTLRPAVEEELLLSFEIKGIGATSAIAGNALDELQVRRLVEGELEPAPGDEHLALEVVNVHDACHDIVESLADGIDDLTTESICDYNAAILEGLTLDEGVVPGEIRRRKARVSPYRWDPPRDCRYLLDRLCDWLNGPDFAVEDDDPFFFAKLIAKALFAHIYLVWISPFAAGNGRTARLVEFRLMAEADLPLASCYLLPDHYNTTRTDYHEVLDRSGGVEPYGVREFFSYALAGLSEQLDTMVAWVITDHRLIVWENILYEHFADRNSPAARRRGKLAQAIRPGRTIPRSEIPRFSTPLARAYAGKNPNTLTRDLDYLVNEDLIIRSDDGYQPNMAILAILRPRSAQDAAPAVHDHTDCPHCGLR